MASRAEAKAAVADITGDKKRQFDTKGVGMFVALALAVGLGFLIHWLVLSHQHFFGWVFSFMLALGLVLVLAARDMPDQ